MYVPFEQSLFSIGKQKEDSAVGIMLGQSPNLNCEPAKIVVLCPITGFGAITKLTGLGPFAPLCSCWGPQLPAFTH